LSREHSLVGRTMHYYMQGSGFEPRTPHLFHHRVNIENLLEDNLNVTIHCKSKDDDLGVHHLQNGDIYGWELNDNFFGTTLFYCSFQWNGELHWYDMYKSSRDSNVCGVCNWYIGKSGPCFLLPDRSTHCFPWNKKLLM